MSHKRRPATEAVHAGRDLEADGAIAPSIHLSTTFARGEDGELAGPHLYSRISNRNRHQLEECLTRLEDGADAACFSSGSAAANVIAQTLRAGDRVVLAHDLYYGVRSLLSELSASVGFELATVDVTDTSSVTDALGRGTTLLWCETPSNPRVEVADLRALAAACKEADTMLVVDNTWATPMLQRPLTLGADLVVHSTTKYLGGHSDVVGGAIVTRDESADRWQRIRTLQRLAGAVPSPFDCWLILRGISTLAVRVEAQCDSAQAIAELLEAHPAVTTTRYPGLPSHPGHALARKQMRRFGGMLSFELSNLEAVDQLMRRLTLFTRATSLGGVHSLAEHRARVEPPDTPTPGTLVRLSVGIEDTDDLLEDLDQALEGI